MNRPKLFGCDCEPGWYWVLRKSSSELELAKLEDVPGLGLLWRVMGYGPHSPSIVDVHSGPVPHPYEGRWSACSHPHEFMRGVRCVYCGTFDVTGGTKTTG